MPFRWKDNSSKHTKKETNNQRQKNLCYWCDWMVCISVIVICTVECLIHHHHHHHQHLFWIINITNRKGKKKSYSKQNQINADAFIFGYYVLLLFFFPSLFSLLFTSFFSFSESVHRFASSTLRVRLLYKRFTILFSFFFSFNIYFVSACVSFGFVIQSSSKNETDHWFSHTQTQITY